MNNSYPQSGYFDETLGVKGEAHSAIFMGYTYDDGKITGMNIFDQYQGHPASIESRSFGDELYTYYPIAQ